MKTYAFIMLLLLVLIASSVSPATAQIWQWIDRDGILTFSDFKPPAQARDAKPIAFETTPDHHSPASTADDPKPSTTTPVAYHPRTDSTSLAHQQPEAAWPAGDVVLIADRAVDEPCVPWAYNDCLRCVKPYSAYNVYIPFTDYAYSRRDPHQPYRWGGRRLRARSYRQHLSYFRRQHHFGYRHYNRDYFSSSYRYRSSAPRYHRLGHTPIDGRGYGLNRNDRRTHSRIYRSGRLHRGAHVGAGHRRGYRSGSGFGSRR